MNDLRFNGVGKLLRCLVAVLALCIWTGVCASAQKMMTSSAWRSVTVDSGRIPARTKIRIRTTEPADVRGGRVFHGVIARDVIGGEGQVLIGKGSDATLAVRHVLGGETVVDLVSVRIDGQTFRPEWSTEETEKGSNATEPVRGIGTCVSISPRGTEILENSLLTFRLTEPLVVVD